MYKVFSLVFIVKFIFLAMRVIVSSLTKHDKLTIIGWS